MLRPLPNRTHQELTRAPSGLADLLEPEVAASSLTRVRGAAAYKPGVSEFAFADTVFAKEPFDAAPESARVVVRVPRSGRHRITPLAHAAEIHSSAGTRTEGGPWTRPDLVRALVVCALAAATLVSLTAATFTTPSPDVAAAGAEAQVGRPPRIVSQHTSRGFVVHGRR
jgi:hypothetical protein